MAASSISPFDLLLRGGRVIDPARNIDKTLDVGIRAGKIAAIGERLPGRAKKTINVAGKLVLPGLIDAHAHVFEHLTRPFGVSPDLAGVRAGVAVLIDQGTSTPFTFQGFRKFIVEPSPNDIYAFMSIFLGAGLFANLHPQWLGPEHIDADLAIEMASANRDVIRGIKVQMEAGIYSRVGYDALKCAIKVARTVGVPVYMHLGHLFPIAKGAKNPDPVKLVREATAMLSPGDIMAHPFSRDPGTFVKADSKVNPAIYKAIKRGVKIDVGRGSHFSFDTARLALAQGIMPDTCGLDMHGLNIWPNSILSSRKKMVAAGIKAEPRAGKRPVVSISLVHTMTELYALGIPLMDIVRMVTVNPAKMIGRERVHGSLAVGRMADVSVLDVEEGEWILRDFHGGTAKATTQFTPNFIVRKGKIFESDVRTPEDYAVDATKPIYQAYAAE